MLKLKKEDVPNSFKRFIIETNEGSFRIYCDNDQNLYWGCDFSDIDDLKDSYSYTITNDNKKVYKIFDKLYQSIVSGATYDNKEIVNPLVKDNVIEWHSDDFEYDAASVLTIEKIQNNFSVTFHRSKLTQDDLSAFFTYSVKIDAYDSRYYSYNINFIDMYNELINYSMNMDGPLKIRRRVR